MRALKLGSLVVLGLMASFAEATSLRPPTQFVCGNVGGTEEWRLMINLDTKRAGFFDNDSTVVVPFKKVSFFESRPPKTVYEFEGKDTAGGGRINISFEANQRTAQITLNLGTRKQKTLKALDGCRAEQVRL
jgi:hypothetical protein